MGSIPAGGAKKQPQGCFFTSSLFTLHFLCLSLSGYIKGCFFDITHSNVVFSELFVYYSVFFRHISVAFYCDPAGRQNHSRGSKIRRQHARKEPEGVYGHVRPRIRDQALRQKFRL